MQRLRFHKVSFVGLSLISLVSVLVHPAAVVAIAQSSQIQSPGLASNLLAAADDICALRLDDPRGTVPFYAGPSTGDTQLGNASIGGRVTLLEQRGDWVRVRSPFTGWIQSNSLEVDCPKNVVVETLDPDFPLVQERVLLRSQVENCTFTVDDPTGRADYYQTFHDDAARAGNLRNRTRLTVEDWRGNWLELGAPPTSGWIHQNSVAMACPQ